MYCMQLSIEAFSNVPRIWCRIDAAALFAIAKGRRIEYGTTLDGIRKILDCQKAGVSFDLVLGCLLGFIHGRYELLF